MNFLSKSSSEDSDFEIKYKNVCDWLRTIDNDNKRIINLMKILIERDVEGSAGRYFESDATPILEGQDGP